MKKVFSTIISMALTLGILSSSVIVGAAQSPQSSGTAQEEQPAVSSSMDNISLESTNSFSNLLNESVNGEVDEQKKNNGFNVFSVEM